MDMNRIVIVLSHPENSANVGAVCRAMANMDCSLLRIVGRRQDYDDGRVRALSLHAQHLWEDARFYDTITAASSDCTMSVGTTRRRGKKRKSFLLLPEEAADRAEAETSGGGMAAFVFGGERTGLTDDEINECTMAMTIPSSESFASLNLSHAVEVVCYCLYRKVTKARQGYRAIDLGRLDEVTEKVAECFAQIGFFSVSGDEGKTETKRFWRGILSRSALSEGEAQYIEHIFEKARGMSAKNGRECKGKNG